MLFFMKPVWTLLTCKGQTQIQLSGLTLTNLNNTFCSTENA